MTNPDFNAAPGRGVPGQAQPGSPGIAAPGPVPAPVFGYARAGTGLIPPLVTGGAGGGGVNTVAQPGLCQPGLAQAGNPGVGGGGAGRPW